MYLYLLLVEHGLGPAGLAVKAALLVGGVFLVRASGEEVHLLPVRLVTDPQRTLVLGLNPDLSSFTTQLVVAVLQSEHEVFEIAQLQVDLIAQGDQVSTHAGQGLDIIALV